MDLSESYLRLTILAERKRGEGLADTRDRLAAEAPPDLAAALRALTFKRGRPSKPPSERAPKKPSSGPSGAHRRATPDHLAEVDALIARARVALAPHAHAYRDLDAALGLGPGTISRLRHELRDLSRVRAAVERVASTPPITNPETSP